MPLTLRRLLSMLHLIPNRQPSLLKCPVHDLPEMAMHADIARSRGRYLDDVQAALGQTRAHGLSEMLPGGDSREPATVHLDCRAEVQAGRRPEKLLKMLRVGRLGQKREDPAAIVVDQNDYQIQLVQTGRQQSVEIVKEREVAEHEHR